MFKKAVRKRTMLKLAIVGPSGTGKTMSALRLATGFGAKKIGVIDCENGSASLYADRWNFEVLDMVPPFTTEKYISAIQDAEKAGIDFLIMDSISHAWAGTGGLMEQKDALDKSGKGSGYTNWGPITKKHEAFKSAFLQANMHIVCTMRSKQDYILVEEKGKQVPKKVGMAAIQRDGMEYEFTTFFELNYNNEAEATKDRTSIFNKEAHQISEETGKKFRAWLDQVPEEVPASTAVKPEATPNNIDKKDPDQEAYDKMEGPSDEGSIVDDLPKKPPTSLALKQMEATKFVIPVGSLKGKKLGEVSKEDALDFTAKLIKHYGTKKLPKDVAQLLTNVDTLYVQF